MRHRGEDDVDFWDDRIEPRAIQSKSVLPPFMHSVATSIACRCKHRQIRTAASHPGPPTYPSVIAASAALPDVPAGSLNMKHPSSARCLEARLNLRHEDETRGHGVNLKRWLMIYAQTLTNLHTHILSYILSPVRSLVPSNYPSPPVRLI